MPFPEQAVLEQYKQNIADGVFNLEQVQKHIQIYFQNLTQSSDTISDEALVALKNTVKTIVGHVLDKGIAFVDKTNPNFRQQIIDKADELYFTTKNDTQIKQCKNDIQTAFIQTIGIGNTQGRSTLIRHSDLSFMLFFNTVTQATLYTINKLDIALMTPTEEEDRKFNIKLANAVTKKGGNIDVVNTDKITDDDKGAEEAVEQVLSRSKDEN